MRMPSFHAKRRLLGSILLLILVASSHRPVMGSSPYAATSDASQGGANAAAVATGATLSSSEYHQPQQGRRRLGLVDSLDKRESDPDDDSKTRNKMFEPVSVTTQKVSGKGGSGSGTGGGGKGKGGGGKGGGGKGKGGSSSVKGKKGKSGKSGSKKKSATDVPLNEFSIVLEGSGIKEPELQRSLERYSFFAIQNIQPNVTSVDLTNEARRGRALQPSGRFTFTYSGVARFSSIIPINEWAAIVEAQARALEKSELLEAFINGNLNLANSLVILIDVIIQPGPGAPPTGTPTGVPTSAPTSTFAPSGTFSPSIYPTATAYPTLSPTHDHNGFGSDMPSAIPTIELMTPTEGPSDMPSDVPSMIPVTAPKKSAKKRNKKMMMAGRRFV